VDALFSLLPPNAQSFKLTAEIALIIVLIVLNLRGMKESIKILLPIFLGFFFTHVFLILYGVIAHFEGLPHLIPDTISETQQLTGQMGWAFAVALFLRAYVRSCLVLAGLLAGRRYLHRLGSGFQQRQHAE